MYWTICASSLAHADAGSRPTAALFACAGAENGDAGLDSVIKTELERLGLVRVTVRPGLDLQAVQLALDCVAQSTACLRSVAASSGVQVLIAPSLERKAGRLELTLLYFDAHGGSAPRSVKNVQSGKRLGNATLDAIPNMLGELFGTFEGARAQRENDAERRAEAPPSERSPDGATPVAATQESSADRALPIAPIVLAGAGVLALAAGVTAGLIAKGTQHDYDALLRRQPLSLGDADEALDKSSSGETQAALSNVMLGVGAAVVIAAGVWLAFELRDPPERAEKSSSHKHERQARTETSFVPIFGPSQVGLGLVHRGVSL